MGSTIHLTLGRITLDWGKNEGFTNHSALFRPGDLTQVPYYYAADEDDPERAHLPLIKSSDNFSYRLITEMQEGYSAPVSVVARRLLLLGHTDAFCREEFEALCEVLPSRHDFTFDETQDDAPVCGLQHRAVRARQRVRGIHRVLLRPCLAYGGARWR
ncbi:HEPN/Toprim-associated domain-containing protein [Caulobacter segnis]